MSDSSSSPDAGLASPPSLPLPQRNVQAPNRPVSGLLSNRRPMASTPIPPSLQAKMTAVSILISLPSLPFLTFSGLRYSPLVPFQMANRSQQTASINAAASGFSNLSLHDRSMPPNLRPPASAPPLSRPAAPPSGLAARRLKMNAPKLNVKDITGSFDFPSGGGTSGAGLGGGRPALDDVPRRSPQSNNETPFATFSRIVYVFLYPTLLLYHHLIHLSPP